MRRKCQESCYWPEWWPVRGWLDKQQCFVSADTRSSIISVLAAGKQLPLRQLISSLTLRLLRREEHKSISRSSRFDETTVFDERRLLHQRPVDIVEDGNVLSSFHLL